MNAPAQGEAEALERHEAIYARTIELVKMYDDRADIDAVQGLAGRLIGMMTLPEAAYGLALFAVRSWREAGLRHHPAVMAAVQALREEIAGNADMARRVVLSNIGCEPGAMYLMCLAWCDAYLKHATGGRPDLDSEIGRMDFVDPVTGSLYTGDNLPEVFAWAGGLLLARANSDMLEYDQVYDRIPGGPGDPEHRDPADDGVSSLVGEHIGALIKSVATTIRNLPRGWAAMTVDAERAAHQDGLM